jgi:hypothetical protein
MFKSKLEETLRKHATNQTAEALLNCMKTSQFNSFMSEAPKIVEEHSKKVKTLREQLKDGETITI